MTLFEILEKVKDENLSLEMCEKYRDALVHLFTTVHLQRADLRKKEAFFFMENLKPEVTDSYVKRLWRVTKEGQRLLELDAYKTILPKEISSLQSRIYSLIPRI